jgi:hypothetical protein
VLELFEAWQLWAVGRIPDDYVLWGLPITWWGRAGKLTSFISGLVIVVDLIGVPRFRSFGASLQTLFSLSEARANVWQGLLLVREMLLYTFSAMALAGARRHPEAYDVGAFREKVELHATAAERTRYYKVNAPLAILLTIGFVWLRLQAPTRDGVVELLMLTFSFIAVSFCFLAPMIILLTTLLATAFLLIIEYLLIEPIARVLDNPFLEKWAKLGSLVCLLLGFHFDLLSS